MSRPAEEGFSSSLPHRATWLQHLGEESIPSRAVVGPIFQTSLFTFETAEELVESITRQTSGPPHLYSRISNPTLQVAEEKIAALEGAEAAKLTACGMAAITNAVMSTLRKDCHVIIPDTAYGPVLHLLDDYGTRFGVQVTRVNTGTAEEVESAIRPETTLIYLESPSSGLFRMQDIRGITAVARRHGITTVIDNTYNTPLHLQPHLMGVDLVCHSVTKYIGGHSDLIGGVIVGRKNHIDRITLREVNLLGNIIHPHAAWLVTRGLRTLALRLKEHERVANEIAAWLETQDGVAKVHHISLPSYPQRDLYLSQMSGSGGLFSFEPEDQRTESVMAFINRLRIFQKGISWGGHESLVVPLRVSPLDYPQPRWVIRLYCGLEDSLDLQADIAQALPALQSIPAHV